MDLSLPWRKWEPCSKASYKIQFFNTSNLAGHRCNLSKSCLVVVNLIIPKGGTMMMFSPFRKRVKYNMPDVSEPHFLPGILHSIGSKP